MVPVLPLDADLLDVAFGFVERGSEGSALRSTTGSVPSLEHCGTCGRVIEWGFLIMEKNRSQAILLTGSKQEERRLEFHLLTRSEEGAAVFFAHLGVLCGCRERALSRDQLGCKESLARGLGSARSAPPRSRRYSPGFSCTVVHSREAPVHPRARVRRVPRRRGPVRLQRRRDGRGDLVKQS